MTEKTMWWNCPEWLEDPDKWPENIPHPTIHSNGSRNENGSRSPVRRTSGESARRLRATIEEARPLSHTENMCVDSRFNVQLQKQREAARPTDHRRDEQRTFMVDYPSATQLWH